MQLDELLSWDADLVLNWLKTIESGRVKPPEGFHWQGLAEAAAFDAREGSLQDPNKLNLK